MATGALLDFGPMLGALQSEGRQVKYLPSFKIDGGLAGEIFSAGALQERVDIGVFGSGAHCSVRPGWPGWPPGLRPEALRRLLGLGDSERSLEGGRELLVLFWAAASR